VDFNSASSRPIRARNTGSVTPVQNEASRAGPDLYRPAALATYGVREGLDDGAVRLARLVTDGARGGPTTLRRQSSNGGDRIVFAAPIPLLFTDGVDEAQ
jgi:hypothetical protein